MWRRQLPACARALCCAGNDDVWLRDCRYPRARKPQRLGEQITCVCALGLLPWPIAREHRARRSA